MARWKPLTLPTTIAYLRAVLFGGRVDVRPVNPHTPGDVTKLDTRDLDLVVAEGRRQIAAQAARFEHVQARGQALTAMALVVSGFTATGVLRLDRVEGLSLAAAWVALGPAFVATLVGIGLAIAIGVVQADFAHPDTTELSSREPPLLPTLAADYAEAVVTGENTIAARVTLLRLATRWFIWGAVLTIAFYTITE